MKTKIDVTGIEKRLNMNSQEFADFLEVDIETVKMFETSGTLDFDAIDTIIQKTDLTFDDIRSGTAQPKVEFHTDDSWKDADTLKYKMLGYIYFQLESINIPLSISRRYVDGLLQGIDQILRKPRMALVGRSDTGKSTLINSLLGMDKMPVSWTPTTSIAVYIKHIDDRPNFIKEDVWVFLDHVGEEKGWKLDKLNDETYCKEWLMEKGEISLLDDFGTRQGKFWVNRIISKATTQQGPVAGSAIVFIDAPILKNVDIIDLPGYGTEEKQDDNITFRTAGQADILVYLSQANGFMRIEDINYLKQNIRQLPVYEKINETDISPLSNLFIVASQAHTVNHGNPGELEKILESGSKRLANTFSRNYWNSRKEESGYINLNYSKDVLPTRFFTYTTDIPSLCELFVQQLESIVHQLPKLLDARVKKYVTQYIASNKPNLEKEINDFEDAIQDREKYKKLFQELGENEWERTKHNNEEKDRIINLIHQYSKGCRDAFSSYYAKKINVDALVSHLKASNIKNKKEQVELYASRVQDELSSRCELLIRERTKQLSEEIKKFIESYNSTENTAFKKASVDVSFDPFDSFLSALGTIGVVGGLGLAVAGFSSITIGVFSTVGISSIFGPIGIGVGVISTAALAVRYFMGGWQRTVAENIVNGFERNNVRGLYSDGMDKYWNDTETAFVEAYLLLEKTHDEYLSNLERHVTETNEENQKQNVEIMKRIMQMYDNFPEDLLAQGD